MQSSTVDNIPNHNMQKICSKFSIWALIILILTFVLGFSLFMSLINSASVLDEWNSLISDAEQIPSGGGALVALIAPFYSLAGVVSLYMIILVFGFCFCLPVFMNSICLILNIVSRFFQIGSEKKWKNIASSIFIYVSTICHGILCLIFLILFILSIVMIYYTGFDLFYFLVYLMIIGNIYFFIKYIAGIKELRKYLISKKELSEEIIKNE